MIFLLAFSNLISHKNMLYGPVLGFFGIGVSVTNILVIC
jgi:hypothetical protein